MVKYKVVGYELFRMRDGRSITRLGPKVGWIVEWIFRNTPLFDAYDCTAVHDFARKVVTR